MSKEDIIVKPGDKKPPLSIGRPIFMSVLSRLLAGLSTERKPVVVEPPMKSGLTLLPPRVDGLAIETPSLNSGNEQTIDNKNISLERRKRNAKGLDVANIFVAPVTDKLSGAMVRYVPGFVGKFLSWIPSFLSTSINFGAHSEREAAKQNPNCKRDAVLKTAADELVDSGIATLSQISFAMVKYLFNSSKESIMLSFKGNHFKKTIVLTTVRWYLAYLLSYRDIEELIAERGIKIDHSTINRWAIKYAPKLEAAFTKKYKKVVGRSWRMGETYIKVKGRWCYLYRAVDKTGDTIDFMLLKNRDEKSAKRFFGQAIGCNTKPEKITIDKGGANNAALQSINNMLPKRDQIKVRQIKYLNNIVEQDHRFIKRNIKPMMGFKAFYAAKATLMGIELHHMLHKKQHLAAANMPVYEQFYALAN